MTLHQIALDCISLYQTVLHCIKCIRLYQNGLDCIRQYQLYQTLLNSIRLNFIVSNCKRLHACFGVYHIVLNCTIDCIRFFWIVSDCLELYQTALDCFYYKCGVLLSFIHILTLNRTVFYNEVKSNTLRHSKGLITLGQASSIFHLLLYIWIPIYDH